MQHAKKMVLVAPETMSVVKDRQISPTAANLSKLDQELQTVLARHDLLPYDKVQLYNQVLQRYLTYYNQAAKTPITVKVTRDKIPDVNDAAIDPIDFPRDIEDASLEGAVGGVETDVEASNLLMNFPVTLVSKAKSLLQLVKNSGGVLDYSKGGELIVEGKAIPGSHISDVIYDILLDKKGFEPRGGEEFLRGLIKMNVPVRLVSNTNRRTKMIRLKQQGLTPPGMADYTHESSPPPKRSKASSKSLKGSKTASVRKVRGRLNWDNYPS